MTCKSKKSVPHPHLTAAGCRHRLRKARYLGQGSYLKPEMPPKACDSTLPRGAPHLLYDRHHKSAGYLSPSPLQDEVAKIFIVKGE